MNNSTQFNTDVSVAAPLLTLHVRGFCSLIDATLELRNGITIIRGVSNEGKSSLLKALYQLLYNPSGRGFINQSLGSCDITLYYGGHTIEYHKTQTSSTKYTIDGDVYDKVTGPLPQLVDLLGFTHGELLTTDRVLFWSQMSLPFLLYDSPKDRYEILSSGIYNLEDVRDLMVEDNKALSKSIDDTNTKLSLLQKDIDRLQQSVFDDTHLREVYDNFFQSQQLYGNLSGLLTVFTNLQSQLSRCHETLNKLNLHNINTRFDELTTLYTKYTSLQQSVKSYLGLVSQYNSYKQQLVVLEQNATKVGNLLSQFTVCPLCHNPLNLHNNT